MLLGRELVCFSARSLLFISWDLGPVLSGLMAGADLYLGLVCRFIYFSVSQFVSLELAFLISQSKLSQ